MVDQKLFDYVKQQLQSGLTREQIQDALLKEGWQKPDINEAFNSPASFNQSVTPNNTFFQSSSWPPAKRLNKILPVIISALGGIFIIGGGVFAYIYYFPSPEKIVQKMLNKLPEIKSFEFSGETNVEINAGDSSSATPNIPLFSVNKNSKTINKFSGALDIRETGNPKFSVAVNVATDAVPLMALAIGAELRVIDKTAYIKLSDLPNLGFINLSVISNQWIKIDPAALQNQSGLKQYEEQIKKAQEKQKLSPEQIEKIKTAFKQAKIIKIIGKLPSEKIEGVNTYHYKYVIDKEGIKKFIVDSAQITQRKALTEEEIAKFDKVFETIESFNGEIWVGKKDLLPYKITSNLAMKETAESKSSGQISSIVSYKNFNQPVKLEVPASVKTIEEVMSGLFGGLKGFPPMGLPGASLPSANQPGLGGGTDADNDKLPDQLETIYGTNPNNPDTDGDGFKDGDEVKNGYNPNGPGKLLLNQ